MSLYINNVKVADSNDDTTIPKFSIVDAGTMSKNQRKVITNPFGNDNGASCIARAEVLIEGEWEGTGWATSAESLVGSGTNAHCTHEGVVVQTGLNYVANYPGNRTGGSKAMPITTSASVRVVLHYIPTEL